MGTENYSIRETWTMVNGHFTDVAYVYSESQEVKDQTASNDKVFRTRGTRTFEAVIKRDEYETMISKLQGDSPKLSFNDFVYILRPIMMGTYTEDELKHAFRLLDSDRSGSIDVDELVSFLPIIDSNINRRSLLRFIGRMEDDENSTLDYVEFKDLVLSGVGRGLLVGNI